MTGLAAALAAGSCVALLVPGRSSLRTRAPDSRRGDSSGLRRWRAVVAGACLLGGWALLGAVVGVLLGATAGWLAWRVLSTAEGHADAERRSRLARDLPLAVSLIATCIQAGAAVESALGTVADAVEGPLAEELRGVHHRLALGLDPAAAWAQLGSAELVPLARAVLRAQESGAALSDAILRLAEDLRDRSRAEVIARASSVEVRAAGPLAACFLPAFVLLAVVPLVVASVSGLDLPW